MPNKPIERPFNIDLINYVYLINVPLTERNETTIKAIKILESKYPELKKIPIYDPKCFPGKK